MIRLAAPDIQKADIAAVVKVLESGQIAQGAEVRELEREMASLCQTKYAVAVCNGTTALYLALLANGIKAGDEVITSAFSFIATTNAILMVGAVPVYADIDLRTYTIDPASVAQRITERTRAIMPVHLYGHPANMPALCQMALQHGLAIIEDAAQAIGATLAAQSVGSFGTGCFSLYATKNITSGEGGMITTNDARVAEQCQLLRSHGTKQKDHHVMLGYNFRLSDIHAALGRQQLQRLDQIIEQRTKNASFFNAHINHPRVLAPTVQDDCVHGWHLYTLRFEKLSRDEVQHLLLQAGIETGIYYPTPAYQQPFLQHLQQPPLSRTELAAQSVLQIPVHPKLKSSELEHIVDVVNSL
jgi:perosamine synthetase